MGDQLLRNLLCQRGVKTTTNVDGCQLLVLADVVGLEFPTLECEAALLGVRLRVDQHILTGSHRHRRGFTVLEARDGLQAIRLFEREAKSVDVLVVDIEMRVMTGYEVADKRN